MKTFLLVTILCGAATAQELLVGGISKIHQGFETWDSAVLQEGKAAIERYVTMMPDDPTGLYWMAFAEYRLVIRSFYEKDSDDDKAEVMIDHAMKCLEKAIAKQPTSDAYALLGSLTGMSIQFSPISGMWKGPKSNGQLENAVKLDAENPRAFYLTGIGKLNTPELFGGGAEKAIPFFAKAVVLYEKESQKEISDPTVPHWGHAECLAFLGSAYAKMQNTEQAKEFFEKALVVNPNTKLAQVGLAKLQRSAE